jgi:hypothetical protein
MAILYNQNELHDHNVKLQYFLTNKRDATAQMTTINDINQILSDMMDELLDRDEQLNAPSTESGVPVSEAVESLLSGSGHSIGQTNRCEDRIPSVVRWVHERQDDDAMKVSGYVPPA